MKRAIPMYKLNEIFYSIQGEGANSGMAALFIRFAGCNLNCQWCDTNHEVKFEMGFDDIYKEVMAYQCRNIVLTGGEPLLQFDMALACKLKAHGYRMFIETNGTIESDIFNKAWVTVSPKTPDFKVRKGNELKLVYTGAENLEEYYQGTEFDHYYLQPEYNRNNLAECIGMVKMNPDWGLSLQTHKIIGIA